MASSFVLESRENEASEKRVVQFIQKHENCWDQIYSQYNILRDLKVRKNANISIFWAGFVPRVRKTFLELVCITEKIPTDTLEKVPG